MTARDQWIEILHCNTCRTGGRAEFSQYSGSDQEIAVERVSGSFKAVMVEYGSSFFCTICESPTEPKAA